MHTTTDDSNDSRNGSGNDNDIDSGSGGGGSVDSGSDRDSHNDSSNNNCRLQGFGPAFIVVRAYIQYIYSIPDKISICPKWARK